MRYNKIHRGEFVVLTIFSPFTAVWLLLHVFFGFEDQSDKSNRYDTARFGAASILGLLCWSIIVALLL